MSKIVVGIIDKSEIFKLQLSEQFSFENGLDLFDCAHERDVFQFIETNSIEVMLVDSDSDFDEALDFSRNILRHYPTTKIIVLNSCLNNDKLFEILRSGAAACFEKISSIKKLIYTIKRVATGDYPINESVIANGVVATKVIQQFQKIESLGFLKTNIVVPLTKREIQILTFIAEGETNKNVAQILGLREQTIKNHMTAIFRKLNANDRAHAVALAIKNQWVAI